MMLLFFVLLIPGAFVAQTSPLGGGLLALVALAVTGWYAEVVKARAGF